MKVNVHTTPNYMHSQQEMCDLLSLYESHQRQGAMVCVFEVVVNAIYAFLRVCLVQMYAL